MSDPLRRLMADVAAHGISQCPHYTGKSATRLLERRKRSAAAS
jgi:hypothetical protein